MSGIEFEIRVRGLVDEDSLTDLGDVDVTTSSASTVLTGEAIDQSALMGLLARLRAHGLVITEFHRHVAAPDTTEPS